MEYYTAVKITAIYIYKSLKQYLVGKESPEKCIQFYFI